MSPRWRRGWAIFAVGWPQINLEDRLPGGGLRPAAEHAVFIEAVVAAAPGLFVNARTDTTG
jgi:hypothetical protein